MQKFLPPDAKSVHYPFWKFVGDVFAFLKPYRGRFLAASLIRLAGDLAWLYPSYALASIVTFLTSYSTGQSLQPIFIIFIFWVIAVMVRILSQVFMRYIGHQVSERVALDVVYQGISHLFSLDMAWHEKENSGNKVKRIQNGGQGLDKIFRIWLNSLIEIGVNFIGMVFIISTFDQTVALATIVFLIIYFMISFSLTRRIGKAAYLVGVEEEKVSGLLFEAVNNIRSVKALAMVKALKKLISQAIENLFTKIKARIIRFQQRHFLLMVWSWIFRLGIIAFIVKGIIDGKYEVGFLILFYGYFSDIYQSVNELSDAAQDISVAKYSISRMKETLNEPVRIDSEEGKVKFPADWQKISVKNLSFSYGKNRVLSDVSFEIKRGERIGIVGLSGAGKSTFFKLLLKEYESENGQIIFDDIPLNKISKSDYFKHVSVVLQETEVFNLSLKDNITIVNPDKAEDTRALKKVIKIAHISDFLKKLPDGVNTLIGEKGIKLSGGEKQRLGIARAIFKQPQLLLLDEATSHLDLESEEKIRESLHDFFEKVTAVVIAHRLTTIKEMDKIILFENGKILEIGDFDSLYQKRGRFFELWEKQKL